MATELRGGSCRQGGATGLFTGQGEHGTSTAGHEGTGDLGLGVQPAVDRRQLDEFLEDRAFEIVCKDAPIEFLGPVRNAGNLNRVAPAAVGPGRWHGKRWFEEKERKRTRK